MFHDTHLADQEAGLHPWAWPSNGAARPPADDGPCGRIVDAVWLPQASRLTASEAVCMTGMPVFRQRSFPRSLADALLFPRCKRSSALARRCTQGTVHEYLVLLVTALLRSVTGICLPWPAWTANVAFMHMPYTCCALSQPIAIACLRSSSVTCTHQCETLGTATG